MKTILAVLTVVILTGCGSSKYPITYETDPPHAAIVCNGQPQGYAPVTLYYDIDREKSNGIFKTQPCYAVWASGARELFISEIPLSQYPNSVTATVGRSPNTLNYSIDVQAAMQRSQEQQQQQPQYNHAQDRGPTYTTCNRVFGQLLCNSF